MPNAISQLWAALHGPPRSPTDLELEDARFRRQHRRERARVLRKAPPGERGNLFEDSFAVLDAGTASNGSIAMASSSDLSRAESAAAGPGRRGPAAAAAASSQAGLAAAAAAAAEDRLNMHQRAAREQPRNGLHFGSSPHGGAKRRSLRHTLRTGDEDVGVFTSPAATFEIDVSAIGDSSAGRKSSPLHSGRPSRQWPAPGAQLAPSPRSAAPALGRARRSLSAGPVRALGRAAGGAPTGQPTQASKPAPSAGAAATRSRSADAAGPGPDSRLTAMRRVLVDSVAAFVSKTAAQKIDRASGVFAAVVAGATRKAARARCRPASGILKAIRSGRPHTTPLSLDAEDNAALQRLQSTAPTSYVVQRAGFSITAAQLRSLNGTEWLNDQVINLYCTMVAEQFPDRCATLGSFLYSKLDAKGRPPAESAKDALRWTADKDVFATAKVLIVVNDGVHWTLAVLNNLQRRLEYYDSMGSGGEKKLEALARFFDLEYAVKREAIAAKRERQRLAAAGKPLPAMTGKQERRMELKAATPAPPTPPSTWPRFSPRREVPQQSNTFDCGVFCSQFALLVAQDVDLHCLGQSDMPFLRRLMMLELLEGKLLSRF